MFAIHYKLINTGYYYYPLSVVFSARSPGAPTDRFSPGVARLRIDTQTRYSAQSPFSRQLRIASSDKACLGSLARLADTPSHLGVMIPFIYYGKELAAQFFGLQAELLPVDQDVSRRINISIDHHPIIYTLRFAKAAHSSNWSISLYLGENRLAITGGHVTAPTVAVAPRPMERVQPAH